MKHKLDKKVFTLRLFLSDLGFLFAKSPQIIGVIRSKEINKSFMEKIMIVVTAVNGCTYCAWYHAKQAVSSGISKNEVKNMFDLQFQADASDFEITALLYAQHYAETSRNPEKEMTDNLFKYYGNKTAEHIILIIRMIFFGNLAGNTFEVFLGKRR